MVAKTWVKDRSASGRLTVVMAETVLLAGSRSISLAETLAVLVKSPAAAAPGTTTRVTVAVAPATRGPMFPVTEVELVRSVPRDEVAETSATVDGRELLKVTNEALFGPPFVMMNV